VEQQRETHRECLDRNCRPAVVDGRWGQQHLLPLFSFESASSVFFQARQLLIYRPGGARSAGQTVGRMDAAEGRGGRRADGSKTADPQRRRSARMAAEGGRDGEGGA
jgi:hypothetical protein